MDEYLDSPSLSDIGDMPDDVFYGTSSVDSEYDDLPVDDDSRVAVDPRVSPEIQRKMVLYDSKNAYLRNSPFFHEIDTDVFLRLIFCRGDDFEMLPFEEEWCEAYEWWTEHERSAKRPAQFSYVYNGIAQAIYGKRQKENKNKTFVITSRAERLHEILQHPFVIMSPVSYTGKRRTKNNARYLYAIGIDIDNVDADNIENLMYQSDPSRPHITFPQPQIIVNSGGGIHLYYLLESPAPMFRDAYPILNKIKKELTRRVWNKGTTHEDPNKPQFQGNCQGFRLPGTQTKFYTKVTAFQNINPCIKPYYSISDLTFGGGGFLTDEEEMLLKKGTYNPNRVTLEQARELYPEWYERRIIKGYKAKRWYIKRDLYDWWKVQVEHHASVGHRYFCLMALAVYAQKCNIPEEEFKSDLMGFVDVMDGLSYSNKEEDRFTVEDALDAAAAFRESYCTFPLEDLRDITGIEIVRNQTRKFKKQEEHLEEARAIRDLRQRKNGTRWDMVKGRKRKQEQVFFWRQEHPEGTKYACAKELGIDKKTVFRWWGSTAEDIQREAELKQARKVSALAMGSAPGHDDVTEAEKEAVHRDLTNAINSSEISVENVFRMLGADESEIPEMKAKFLALMSTPGGWEMFNKERENIVLPSNLQDALERVSAERKEKGKI